MSFESAVPIPGNDHDDAALTKEQIEAVASRAASWVNERRGHLMLEMAPSPARSRLLDQLGARLPAAASWARTRAPQRIVDLAVLLLDGETFDVGSPARLAEAVGQLCPHESWTVLAINDADEAGPEALLALEALAGLGPALQIVFVGSPGFAGEPGHAATDALAAHIGRRIAVEDAFASEPVIEPIQPWSETRATAPAPSTPPPAAPSMPLSAATSMPRPAALERQRDQDPFRHAPTGVSLNTPALIPVLSAPHDAHTEWFRILRLRLEDWVRRTGGGSKTLLVTGPDVAMGKTFVSANLALLWAQSTGQRVLLVDGDLRRPQFHAVFEIPRRPGFADVLSRRHGIDESVSFVAEVGLHVMPAGRPGNPRHLVNSERVERAVAGMREAFDFVVIDSPPLNGMVDGRSMAAASDGVLMVVRSRRTRFQSLQKALELLPGNNLVGAVVNAGEIDAESAYYKYRRAAER